MFCLDREESKFQERASHVLSTDALVALRCLGSLWEGPVASWAVALLLLLSLQVFGFSRDQQLPWPPPLKHRLPGNDTVLTARAGDAASWCTVLLWSLLRPSLAGLVHLWAHFSLGRWPPGWSPPAAEGLPGHRLWQDTPDERVHWPSESLVSVRPVEVLHWTQAQLTAMLYLCFALDTSKDELKSTILCSSLFIIYIIYNWNPCIFIIFRYSLYSI